MRIAVLAEQNFNLIDGSTIWLLNVCKLLALQEDLDTTLVLSHRLTTNVLADELPDRIARRDMAQIASISGLTGDSLTPETVIAALSSLERAEGRFDRIFVRGERYVETLMAHPDWRSRLVAYAPSAIPDLSLPEPNWVSAGRAARVPVVVQSAAAKQALESLSDYPAHVVHVVPPIVFEGQSAPLPPRNNGPVTLCYSGKIDLHYGLDWLLDFAEAIGDQSDLALHLIAGKDTWRSRSPEFFKRMDRLRREVMVGKRRGVSLVSGLPHAEAKAEMGRAQFAYCLRHSRYDDVIEISTKIVEFCTLGVVPILNDNALNRDLFGDDYPYYIDIVTEDVGPRLTELMRTADSAIYDHARARIADVARQFSASALSDQLGRALRGHPHGAPALTDRPHKVLIATHERKFLRQFIDRLRGDPKVELQWQDWVSTVKPAGVLAVPEDVDTVFCEWCCENAVWHSKHKRPGTRLVVRLHRFEAFRDFPSRVDWSAVDALIVVSNHFRDLMVEHHGVDPARIRVMPQFIDWNGLQREKLPAARFTLGLVGINPFDHKRFDRAIDFFAALRSRDDRFRLAVRSAMPWEIEWVWNNRPEERGKFLEVFDRIFTEPGLEGAVRFDPAGPDMEQWYRDVGTILSSSDTEGCHTAVIEGMASGCYPVVHDWPGARSLFDPYVHADMTEAIDAVIAFADQPRLDKARNEIASAVQRHDVEPFAQAFFTL